MAHAAFERRPSAAVAFKRRGQVGIDGVGGVGCRDARSLVTRGKRDGTVQGTRWLARHILPHSDQHAASAVRCSMSEICFMIEISDALYSLRCEARIEGLWHLDERKTLPHCSGDQSHSTFITDQFHCDNCIRILEVNERRGALLP
jgi:hypothetical protein